MLIKIRRYMSEKAERRKEGEGRRVERRFIFVYLSYICIRICISEERGKKEAREERHK